MDKIIIPHVPKEERASFDEGMIPEMPAWLLYASGIILILYYAILLIIAH